MLNTDYKLYAKVLANWLQSVTPYLINNDQVGFIKGRNIAHNIIDLLTIIEYCEQNSLKAVLTSVDFEKAFDSVSWKGLEKILYAFGFGKKFVERIFLCFRNFRLAVGNNGHITSYFDVKRGNKQGCPVLALICPYIVEIIALKIRQNLQIQKVEIEGIQKILSQYADDL